MTTEPIELTLRIVPVDQGADFTAGMVVGLLRGAGLHVAGLDLDTTPLPTVEEFLGAANEATLAGGAWSRPLVFDRDGTADLGPPPEPVDPDAVAQVERDRLDLLARLEREQAGGAPEPIERRPFDPDAARARAAQGL